MKRHIAVALTGASGAIYGIRLIEELLAAGNRVSLLISGSGRTVLKEELGLDWSGDEEAMNSTLRDHFKAAAETLTYYRRREFLLSPGKRLGRSRCDDHRPLLHGDSGADSRRPVGQPAGESRRCDAERGETAAASPPRDTFFGDPSGKHAQAGPPRRQDRPGHARLLQPPADGRRYRQFCRRQAA